MVTAPEQSLLLTRAEASQMLKISERLLWGMTMPRGEIPCRRIGAKLVRYERAALEKWIAEQACEGDAQ